MLSEFSPALAAGQRLAKKAFCMPCGGEQGQLQALWVGWGAEVNQSISISLSLSPVCTYCSTGDLYTLWKSVGHFAEAVIRLFATELVLVLGE